MNNNLKPIEISDEDITRDDRRKAEVPVITIERDNDAVPESATHKSSPAKRRSYWRIAGMAVIIILLLLLLAGGLFIYRYPSLRSEMPVSVTDAENIAKLETPFTPDVTGVEAVSDSVLGVAFDMYPLAGLAASLESALPDTADTSLVLFCRSADYRSDNTVIGSMAIDGNIIPDNDFYIKSRAAYLAISPQGLPVIGVSYNNKVMEHVAGMGGSFFRQFPLLSDGTLPVIFPLRGKVERAAIGRMEDDRLFYILTRHKETMYDFADALREYGFMDAMYVTGGNAYSFYRDTNGVAHVDSALNAKYMKYGGDSPAASMLVFRSGK